MENTGQQENWLISNVITEQILTVKTTVKCPSVAPYAYKPSEYDRKTIFMATQGIVRGNDFLVNGLFMYG